MDPGLCKGAKCLWWYVRIVAFYAQTQVKVPVIRLFEARLHTYTFFYWRLWFVLRQAGIAANYSVIQKNISQLDQNSLWFPWHTRHKLAEIKTEIAVTRAFFDQCLLLHSEGRLDNQMASMAKLHCTELQNSVATRCLQLHGGWGYMWLVLTVAMSSFSSAVADLFLMH